MTTPFPGPTKTYQLPEMLRSPSGTGYGGRTVDVLDWADRVGKVDRKTLDDLRERLDFARSIFIAEDHSRSEIMVAALYRETESRLISYIRTIENGNREYVQFAVDQIIPVLLYLEHLRLIALGDHFEAICLRDARNAHPDTDSSDNFDGDQMVEVGMKEFTDGIIKILYLGLRGPIRQAISAAVDRMLQIDDRDDLISLVDALQTYEFAMVQSVSDEVHVEVISEMIGGRIDTKILPIFAQRASVPDHLGRRRGGSHTAPLRRGRPQHRFAVPG